MTPSQQASGRRADIQGLRALAVAIVVLYHSGLPFPGGFVGVDVFFVISGFVITGMLLNELNEKGSVDYARFYRRRIRRLLPAMALVLVVTAVGSIALLGPLGQQETAAETGAAASVFVANLQLVGSPNGYFDGPAEGNPFLHTWSLSAEEQLYLFLPVFLAVAWRVFSRRSARQRKRLLVGTAVGAVVIGSFAFSYTLTADSANGLARAQEVAFYSSPTRVWEFGSGVLLALGARRLVNLSDTARSILGIAGFGLIGASVFTINDFTPFPGVAALMPVIGAAMILAGGVGHTSGVISKALSVKPAVWIGDISYSWYLWHWPLIVFSRTVWPRSTIAPLAAAAVSLLPAAASFRFVENPIRNGNLLPAVTGPRIAALSIGLPLAALSILGVASRGINQLPHVADLTTSIRYSAATVRGCDQLATVASPLNDECTWIADSAEGSIYLVGDSNASQFTETLVAAASAATYDLTVDTLPACPFVDVALFERGREQTQCEVYVRSLLKSLVDEAPDVVVIASGSDIYLNQERWEFLDPTTGRLTGDPIAKAAIWEQGLQQVLDRFDQAGIATIIINPIPHFFFDDDFKVLLDNCPAFRLLHDTGDCGSIQSRAYLEEQRRNAVEAELAAAAAVASTTTIDFIDQLCSQSSCSMYRDGGWLYRDGTHVSVDGAIQLTERFSLLLAQVTRN